MILLFIYIFIMPGGTKKSKKKKVDEPKKKLGKKSKKVELKVRVKTKPKKKEELKTQEVEEKMVAEEKKKKPKTAEKKTKQSKEKKIEKPLFEEKGRIIHEDTEKDRKLLMWAGVIFFMILIAAGWLYNAKRVFEENKIEGKNESMFNFENWDKMTNELSDKVIQMKEDLESLKEFKGSEEEPMNASSSERDLFATSTEESIATTTEEIDEEKDNATKTQLEQLKEKLEALEKELEE